MIRIAKVLAISSFISVMLVFIRMEWSTSIAFIFLPWNLFLAWVPFICALILSEMRSDTLRIIRFAVLMCWLMFFPNAPYILTDLFHLHKRPDVPLWYDLVLIISFAWNGLLLGFVSLFEIQRYLRIRFSDRMVDLFVVAMMVMCSFGIYLGRYPRWNSWDLISNPFALFRNIFGMLLHPMDNTRMIGVTFFFSLFLLTGFWTMRALVKNLKLEGHDK